MLYRGLHLKFILEEVWCNEFNPQTTQWICFIVRTSVCLAVWLGAALMPEAGLAFRAISAISLILLVRQTRLLYDAALIWDNRILAVPLFSSPCRAA